MKQFHSRVGLAFRSLTFRWILALCVVVLPINMLTAVISRIVMQAYEERVRESLFNQLKIYADSTNTDFSNTMELMQEFFEGDTLRALNFGDKDDSVLQVLSLKNKLGSTIILKRIQGEIYVWDKEKDIVSFFSMNQMFSREKREELKSLLRMEKASQAGTGSLKALQVEDAILLAKRFDFQKYAIGIVFDSRQILRGYRDICGDLKGDIYLADAGGKLWLCLSEEGNGNIVEDGMLEKLDTNGKDVLFAQNIFSDEYQIVWAISHSEMMSTLPVLVTVLYALTLLSFVALPLLCLFAVRLVLRPLVKLVEAMRVLEGGNLEYHLEGKTGTYQMDFLYSCFNHMVDELHSLIVTSYEREIEKLQTDAINMRLQVNQHMLLNSLNTIYNLNRTGKIEQSNEFTRLLSKYFRYVLRSDVGLVTVREEMDFVNDYLQIQKIRFPGSFTNVYSVDEEAADIVLPQLLIQNFVENAVKYGLVLGTEIEILVIVCLKEERLVVSVCDTGNGMEPEVLDQLKGGRVIEDQMGKHIGIWNCRRRLKYYYGDEYTISMTSEKGQGTQVWIEIPVKPMEQEEAARKVHQLDRVIRDAF